MLNTIVLLEIIRTTCYQNLSFSKIFQNMLLKQDNFFHNYTFIFGESADVHSGIFEKSIKTNWVAIEIHRFLEYA